MKLGNIVKTILGFFRTASPILDLIPQIHERLARIEGHVERQLGLEPGALDQLVAELRGAIADPDTGPKLKPLLQKVERVLSFIAR